MSQYIERSSGTDTLGLMTIAFIVLKLCGVIDWSWWWVLSPTLIPIGLLLIGLAAYGIWLYFTKP